jgi:hypothetical protein
MKKQSSLILWAILAFAAQGALAGSMLCGETVIQDGELQPVTAEQVLAACGEPTTKEFGQWVYAQPGELAKTLRFDAEGNLQSITTQVEGE